MIGICTDSHSVLPTKVVERFGIEVVPITVNIDDHEYLEGIDLDADAFYELLHSGAAHIVTSQPSPGQFALAYETLAQRGANQIISIHSGAGVSGTLNSARLATRCSPVPVRVVDTNTRTLALTCSVWAAAEAVANGADLARAMIAAEAVGSTVGNLFVVGASTECRAGQADEPVSLMRWVGNSIEVVEKVASLHDAAKLMAKVIADQQRPINLVFAHADHCGVQLTNAVEQMMHTPGNVREISHARVGPSLGSQRSACVAGLFFYSPC